MQEEWRPVVGFEDMYMVSNDGHIRNIKRQHDLVPELSNGYYRVCLSSNGKTTHKFVHRVVAEAFIPNPDNKPFIDHINGIRNDNRIENLRWCTSKENSNNPVTRKAMLERTSSEEYKQMMRDISNSPTVKARFIESHAHRMRAVRDIDTGEEWRSLAEAATATGLTRQAIAWSCRNSGRKRRRSLKHWHGKRIHHFEWCYNIYSKPETKEETNGSDE